MKYNPKHIQQMKEGKPPMEYIPYNALEDVARVMKTGAQKYGLRNWREDEILASTYVAAIARHALLEWAQGKDVDDDSGQHPLAHVAACCLIVMDAQKHDTLLDDRTITESLSKNNE